MTINSLWAGLERQPPDSLLALIGLYAADPRSEKIDLGVGVYRTGQGDTPVFAAVKAGERKLLESQTSKAYLGPEGDMGFVHALMPYVFGAANPTMDGRIDGMQTPGGTGGVRLAVALAQKAGVKRIWMGTPSWPNHAQILADLGLELKTFNHATKSGVVDMDALRGAIAEAETGDAVLLHGCCHNPTGIDYSPADWDEIAPALKAKGLLPVLDLAYQGLGFGMEEDAYGVRRVLADPSGEELDLLGGSQNARALKEALGDKIGINRYGFFLPMDDASSEVQLQVRMLFVSYRKPLESLL